MPKSRNRSFTAGAVLIAIAGIVGAAVALSLYITPLTGVTGTPGALIVLVASLLVSLGAVLMMTTGRRVWRWLTVLGILGTGLAAAFLHGWWIVAAMAVAALGFVLDGLGPVRRKKGAQA